MRRSQGTAVAILMLIAVLLPNISVCASAAFPSVADWTIHPGIAAGNIFEIQAPSGDAMPSRGPTIDESYNDRSIHVLQGQVLVVRLKEADPGQAWRLAGGDRFSIVSEATLESYPAQHVFRVKVRGPGDLSFAKVDRKSQWTIETFAVHVVVDEKVLAGEPETSNPLSGFAALRPCLFTFYP